MSAISIELMVDIFLGALFGLIGGAIGSLVYVWLARRD